MDSSVRLLPEPGPPQIYFALRHLNGQYSNGKLHRHVTRGAKGIMIFAPLVQRIVDGNECGVETQRETLVGYRAAVVFDVADTSGNPLPELSKFEGNPGEYLERLKSLVTQSGCSLEYSRSILPAQGQCSGAKITVLPGLSAAEEFHVLTHELAHSRLQFLALRPAGCFARGAWAVMSR